MNLRGFNFSKISVEKSSEKPSDLKVSANINIENISEVNSKLLKTKENVLAASFSYTVKYGNFATVDLKGNVLVSLDQKLSKKVLKEWKNKKMVEEFRTPVLNLVLAKANVKALQLEEEMNLPYHLPMPRVNSDKNKQPEKK